MAGVPQTSGGQTEDGAGLTDSKTTTTTVSRTKRLKEFLLDWKEIIAALVLIVGAGGGTVAWLFSDPDIDTVKLTECKHDRFAVQIYNKGGESDAIIGLKLRVDLQDRFSDAVRSVPIEAERTLPNLAKSYEGKDANIDSESGEGNGLWQKNYTKPDGALDYYPADSAGHPLPVLTKCEFVLVASFRKTSKLVASPPCTCGT